MLPQGIVKLGLEGDAEVLASLLMKQILFQQECFLKPETRSLTLL